jgi:signal transduction histidine kinase
MTRLISLVNRIMDYEKNDRKKLSLVLAEHNISDIIKQLSETHKKSLKENKQRIKVT